MLLHHCCDGWQVAKSFVYSMLHHGTYPVMVCLPPCGKEKVMKRSGFSTIEMVLLMVLLGVIAAIGFPRVRRAVDKANVRSTPVFLGTAAMTARQVAVARSCRGVVHLASASGTVWVTVCPRLRPGVGTVDTLGPVEPLAERYSVTLIASRDSVQFDPRGMSMDNASTTIRIQGKV